MKSDQLLYGELVVIGSNGKLPGGDKGRRRSKFLVYRRPDPNGIKPGSVEHVQKAKSSQAVISRETHAVSYTLSRNEAVVVQYEDDPSTDMFQIGRNTDRHIDMVVSDTDFYNSQFSDNQNSTAYESTISRFACRILINREPPHTARIYAAGFDSSRNIFLGEKAVRWRTDGKPDGLTTNGVMILRPPASSLWPSTRVINPQSDHTEINEGSVDLGAQNSTLEEGELPVDGNTIDADSQSRTDTQLLGSMEESGSSLCQNQWREISVGGGVYAMRNNRSIPRKSHRLPEINELVDGTLIDLCGVTLLWRSYEGLTQSATMSELTRMVDSINRLRPQCPVRYQTLCIPRPKPAAGLANAPHSNSNNNNSSESNSQMLSALNEDEESEERQPFVYLKCGHVHGKHEWKAENDTDTVNNRTCPLCIQSGPFVPLQLGVETSFYVDREKATHCFNPCGHFASKKTVEYWCSVKLPNRNNYEMHSLCPFCARVINAAPVRLIFQEDIS